MVDLTNTWIFDIETRMRIGKFPNFYQKAAEFLCLVAINPITNEEKIWTKDDNLDEMFKFLFSVDYLAGHNIRAYDIKALGHLFPDHKEELYKIQLIDTRWLALKDKKANPNGGGLFTYKEMKAFDKAGGYEPKSPNSLEAWGYRLGDHKLDAYADYKDEDWNKLALTDELIDYCIQDVNLNIKLFMFLLKEKGVEYGVE